MCIVLYAHFSIMSLHLGVCIGPGPDRPRPKTEFGAGCGSRIGPDRSRTGLLLSNSATLQTCTRDLAWSGRNTRHDRAPLVFWAQSARAASIREKKLLKFDPLVPPRTGPKTEFSKITDRRPDRRGPIRFGLELKTAQAYLPHRFLSSHKVKKELSWDCQVLCSFFSPL